MANKIVAINGSYRRNGITAQAVAEAAAGAREAGAEVTVIELLDKHIEFCTNCRACAREPGEERGGCFINDEMAAVLDQVDAADGLILAAPVNFFNVTAITRRFIERLICYGYWPRTAMAPKLRIKKPLKKAVLITSAAMPSFAGRLFTGALRALEQAAANMGAKRSGSLFIGMVSDQEHPALSSGEKRKARRLGRLLA